MSILSLEYRNQGRPRSLLVHLQPLPEFNFSSERAARHGPLRANVEECDANRQENTARPERRHWAIIKSHLSTV